MKPKLRDTQTRVKHEILSSYLDTWGGIILNGLFRSTRKYGWRFIYVDCFAFQGKYAGDKEDTLHHRSKQEVYGSPVIGVNALDKLREYATKQGLGIITNAILIEKDPAIFRELRKTLQDCGWGARLRETTDFASLKNGEIALVNCSAPDVVDQLIGFTDQQFTWAFYLLDPWGASGIPYSFVQKVVSCQHHDVMINLIYEDFQRKSGMATNDDLDTSHLQLVDYWRRAYGDRLWDDEILPKIREIESHRTSRDTLTSAIGIDVPFDDMPEGFQTDAQLSEARERICVYGYRRVLQNMDAGITIKPIDLKFPDKERVMLYLFLTTHDPTGALQLNKILSDAKLLEHELRCRLKILSKLTKLAPLQLDLLDPVANIPTPPVAQRPKTEEVASYILEKLKGCRVSRKDVYSLCAETHYFPNEIDSALSHLRTTGQVQFDGKLKHQTLIQFA